MSDTKRIIVTGASSGVGEAVAARVQDTGAAVTTVDIKPPTCADYEHINCDLSDPRAVESLIAQLPERIDGLINVAGLPGPEPAGKVMAVNFLAARMLCEAMLPRLNEGGSITNIASIAGRDWLRRRDVIDPLLHTASFEDGMAWCEANRDRWAKDPYTFSKQCLTGYTMRLAGRALGTGKRANIVSPGGVTTALTPAFRDQVGEEQFQWAIKQTGRQATPDEIAEVISFVALGPCRWLNGADIIVDGGFVAGLLSGWIDPATSPAARARAARAASR